MKATNNRPYEKTKARNHADGLAELSILLGRNSFVRVGSRESPLALSVPSFRSHGVSLEALIHTLVDSMGTYHGCLRVLSGVFRLKKNCPTDLFDDLLECTGSSLDNERHNLRALREELMDSTMITGEHEPRMLLPLSTHMRVYKVLRNLSEWGDSAPIAHALVEDILERGCDIRLVRKVYTKHAAGIKGAQKDSSGKTTGECFRLTYNVPFLDLLVSILTNEKEGWYRDPGVHRSTGLLKELAVYHTLSTRGNRLLLLKDAIETVAELVENNPRNTTLFSTILTFEGHHGARAEDLFDIPRCINRIVYIRKHFRIKENPAYLKELKEQTHQMCYERVRADSGTEWYVNDNYFKWLSDCSQRCFGPMVKLLVHEVLVRWP